LDFNFVAGIASIVGLLASGLGLAFSIKAWQKATDAERAADNATQAVRRGNAAEDLQGLADKAKEMLTCVDQN